MNTFQAKLLDVVSPDQLTVRAQVEFGGKSRSLRLVRQAPSHTIVIGEHPSFSSNRAKRHEEAEIAVMRATEALAKARYDLEQLKTFAQIQKRHRNDKAGKRELERAAQEVFRAAQNLLGKEKVLQSLRKFLPIKAQYILS